MKTYTADTLEYKDDDEIQLDIQIFFTVPRDWAEKWCKQDELFESLEEFDEEYVWDDSWEMYLAAQEDGVIINTEEFLL